MKIFALLSSLLLSGCLSAATSIANMAARSSDYERIADIPYGDEARQRLDLYVPTSGGAHPVLVFFYGGRWQMGKKEDFEFAAEPFVAAGYVVAVPDYAKYPAHRYPTFVADAAKAVAWVHGHAKNYGGDASRLFIAGHSSGAHIGALLATDARYLKAEGKSRTIIRGFAGLAGPYDFIPEDEDIVAIFSPAGGDAQSAMPSRHVDGRQPPMLLLYGLDDAVVQRSNLEAMRRQVKAKGGELAVKTYPGIDHVGIAAALSEPARGKAPVVADMLSFFREHE